MTSDSCLNEVVLHILFKAAALYPESNSSETGNMKHCVCVLCHDNLEMLTDWAVLNMIEGGYKAQQLVSLNVMSLEFFVWEMGTATLPTDRMWYGGGL